MAHKVQPEPPIRTNLLESYKGKTIPRKEEILNLLYPVQKDQHRRSPLINQVKQRTLKSRSRMRKTN